MLKCENESDGSSESMNGSWVKLEPTQNSHSLNHSPRLSDGEEMETLLADAVDEQMKFLRPQVDQENSKELIAADHKSDWVEAWASRPEQQPSKKLHMEHPSYSKSSALSIRRTKVMKSSADLRATDLIIIVPILIISHAVTLGVGIYIGRKLNVSLASK